MRNRSPAAASSAFRASIRAICSLESLLAHPVRDRQALRVVGDRHEGPAERACGRHHLAEGEGSVAVGRVDLEVGVRSPLPVGIRVEHRPDLREREVPGSRLVGLREDRRGVEPTVDPLGHPGTDRLELGQRPAGRGQIRRLLAPETGGAGGTTEGAPAMRVLLLAGAPQEVGQVAVRQARVAHRPTVVHTAVLTSSARAAEHPSGARRPGDSPWCREGSARSRSCRS